VQAESKLERAIPLDGDLISHSFFSHSFCFACRGRDARLLACLLGKCERLEQNYGMIQAINHFP